MCEKLKGDYYSLVYRTNPNTNLTNEVGMMMMMMVVMMMIAVQSHAEVFQSDAVEQDSNGGRPAVQCAGSR